MSEPTWRLAADGGETSEFDPARFRWLTQVGGRTFKEQPRWHREIVLSMQGGRHNAADAVMLCYRRPSVDKDRVRFLRVADLLASGYWAYPSPVPGNPDHAVVRSPILENDIDLHMAWWAREDRVTLQQLARY
jgi:hypothetical protein